MFTVFSITILHRVYPGVKKEKNGNDSDIFDVIDEQYCSA